MIAQVALAGTLIFRQSYVHFEINYLQLANLHFLVVPPQVRSVYIEAQ